MDSVVYQTRISDWPEQERPRERLLAHGPEALADAELLAIILRTGSGKSTAVDIARHLLREFKGLRGIDSQPIEVLQGIKGIGLAKAAQIKSALELAKRISQTSGQPKEIIKSSEDVHRLVHLRMRDLTREEFRVLFLTIRGELITHKRLFEGSLGESVVSPREIILASVQMAAAAVILCHNHPSGDPSPSTQDRQITRKILTACRYCDIQVFDHLIIGRDSYYSFADNGILNESG